MIDIENNEDIFLNIFKTKNKEIDKKLIFFDVGAHIGQSAIRFKKRFQNCAIHCFEPYEKSFLKLNENTKKQSNIHYNNIALGKEEKLEKLYINEKTETSSFFKLNQNYSEKDKTKNINTKLCKVRKLDNYVLENNIKKIDYLKIDVQGEEYSVLIGSEETLKLNKISFIEIEIILNDYYSYGGNNLLRVLTYLEKYNFRLLNLTNMDFDNDNCLKWFDLLFVSNETYP